MEIQCGWVPPTPQQLLFYYLTTDQHSQRSTSDRGRRRCKNNRPSLRPSLSARPRIRKLSPSPTTLPSSSSSSVLSSVQPSIQSRAGERTAVKSARDSDSRRAFVKETPLLHVRRQCHSFIEVHSRRKSRIHPQLIQ